MVTKKGKKVVKKKPAFNSNVKQNDCCCRGRCASEKSKGSKVKKLIKLAKRRK